MGMTFLKRLGASTASQLTGNRGCHSQERRIINFPVAHLRQWEVWSAPSSSSYGVLVAVSKQRDQLTSHPADGQASRIAVTLSEGAAAAAIAASRPAISASSWPSNRWP